MKSIQEIQAMKYTDAKALRAAFHQTNDANWHHISDNDALMEAENTSELFEFLEQLLADVHRIHQMEQRCPVDVRSIIDSTLNTRSMRGRLMGSYVHHDMYFMDADCDYVFIGDVHSDAHIIPIILDQCDFFARVFRGDHFKLIFLGDYVDRGHHHLKTVQTLLLLKAWFPQHIYLLMGNHDIGHIEDGEVTLYLRKVEEDMDYIYLYINELHQRNPHFTDELLALYLQVMNSLNVCAWIMTPNVVIQAVHGGIPRPDGRDRFDYLTQYAQLTDETTDYEGFRIRDCLLWSDPGTGAKQPLKKLKRFTFYRDQLENYLSHMGIDLLIRGHQAMEKGFESFFDQQLYTVFSSGRIMKDGENLNQDTAYDFVSPQILRYDRQQGLPLIPVSLGDI